MLCYTVLQFTHNREVVKLCKTNILKLKIDRFEKKMIQFCYFSFRSNL